MASTKRRTAPPAPQIRLAAVHRTFLRSRRPYRRSRRGDGGRHKALPCRGTHGRGDRRAHPASPRIRAPRPGRSGEIAPHTPANSPALSGRRRQQRQCDDTEQDRHSGKRSAPPQKKDTGQMPGVLFMSGAEPGRRATSARGTFPEEGRPGRRAPCGAIPKVVPRRRNP